jgi:hypothetical protein
VFWWIGRFDRLERELDRFERLSRTGKITAEEYVQLRRRAISWYMTIKYPVEAPEETFMSAAPTPSADT